MGYLYLNLSHGNKTKKSGKKEEKTKNENILRSISKQSRESVPKKQKATEGRICGKGRFY